VCYGGRGRGVESVGGKEEEGGSDLGVAVKGHWHFPIFINFREVKDMRYVLLTMHHELELHPVVTDNCADPVAFLELQYLAVIARQINLSIVSL
jgi:hypothetical protein